ncbi:hypothetical protein RB653_002857 [Dictyostelium firmibasis]|uniref:EGF-like domain-containing protein n=1 Tax=Dictyostelium firmibasis TaxID=79012 RepID=A0AAN7YNE5_9MYCE
MKIFVLYYFICLFLINKTFSQLLNSKEVELTTKYNSTNYCISEDVICSTVQNELYVSDLIITSINSYIVILEDIQCFSKIKSIYFKNFQISNNLLQGPFPTLSKVSFSNCTTNYTQMFSLQVASTFDSIYIDKVQSPINASINLSSLKSLNSFTFYLKDRIAINNIQLINDYPDSSNGIIYKKPEIFYVDINDFPNMDNIGYEFLSIQSYSPPNQGYKYIQTLKNIKSLVFYVKTGSIDFNQFSLIPKNNSITDISYNGENTKIETTIKVDLSNLTSMKRFSLGGDLSGFNIYGGKLPLMLPNSLNFFGLKTTANSGVNYSEISEFFINNPNISNVDFRNNNIFGNFSQWKNIGCKEAILEYNNLQGSVDSSWCTSKLMVDFNQLSGPLPSCFTCHINSFFVNSWIGNKYGNNFSNISPPPPCTTLIPNLRYEKPSSIYDFVNLYLYGQDLGFSDMDIRSSMSTFFKVITPSILFAAYLPADRINIYIDLQFEGPGQTYRVSTIQKAPIVDKLTPTIISRQLTFDGSFFNYNKSSFNILVDNYQCLTDSSTFFQINCTMIQSFNFNEKTLSKITINVNDYYYYNLTVLTTTFFAYLNQTTVIIGCTSDCTSLGGICNSEINQCYFLECPNNCTNSFSGLCDKTTGICKCTYNHQGSDCSLPLIPCNSNCGQSLGNGICNNQTGICSCTVGLQGEDCSIPSHYITSIIPCSTDGGEVSIDGWFGNDYDGTHTLSYYTVIIGQLDCIVTSINKSTIKCNLGSGTGSKSIKIINTKHTNVLFIGNGLFNYQNQIKTCPNNCSSTNNGKCNSNTGECECNNKFTGFDCSMLISILPQPSTNSTVNNKTGQVELNNQDTKYEISILSLNEISFDGSVIISHQLNRNWSIYSNNTESNKFKFSQTLINNTCTITYMIEEIKNENKNFTFGTTTFTLEKDSIKLTVSINNYQYQSTLNTLQLVFYSAVVDTNSTDNNNECNKKEASIDTSEINNQGISNYIQISKNSKILVGRFINQVISDSRATFMSSTIIKDKNDGSSTSSIKLGLNLPHCNECLIDPDFSVLVSSDFKQSCSDDGSNKNKWLIPVAVVVPVIGCALIFVVAIIIYKKNRINIKIVAFKLKSFKNKQ